MNASNDGYDFMCKILKSFQNWDVTAISDGWRLALWYDSTANFRRYGLERCYGVLSQQTGLLGFD
jgi:hypothetical protein